MWVFCPNPDTNFFEAMSRDFRKREQFIIFFVYTTGRRHHWTCSSCLREHFCYWWQLGNLLTYVMLRDHVSMAVHFEPRFNLVSLKVKSFNFWGASILMSRDQNNSLLGTKCKRSSYFMQFHLMQRCFRWIILPLCAVMRVIRLGLTNLRFTIALPLFKHSVLNLAETRDIMKETNTIYEYV